MVNLYTASSILYMRDNVTSTISGNVTTEQTLFSANIIGSSLTLLNRLAFEFYLSLTTGPVLPGALTLRIYYGTQVLVLGGGTSLSLVASQTSQPFAIRGRLRNIGATNSQYFFAQTTQPQAGLVLAAQVASSRVLGAQDSTVDQILKITAQFTLANANNSLALEDYEVRIV